MILIREVVQQALSTGFLTVEAEELLREMLQGKYGSEDLKAFMSLQQAAMSGQVTQESRVQLEEKILGQAESLKRLPTEVLVTTSRN
ncbi:hypothetical protein H6F78_03660 [Coleofasciculus sp. FACHB-64]|uniref:hypothetical protein n=1 Tax=Cyanophyceae TaxID=3028117 RepID=UPI001684FAD7|nr:MULTISPECIES: hypothetical protein [unclassified Coleofasciculus]MBD1837375.1 hypothetical protein [Coleofasciculus sp. FACHB-501]MBD1887973.1 hypothetical protein [Coleofasciculus sp. FACHB-SPT9]MBD1893777.1 hypothetical protein [Coleofasciculus sp. FACHB-129]MBD2044738.1 hypothetical protein [Coleofasciculus sp. FACHB-64]MBD2084605.1 hypothetical protein [Coleofasciculus sp. FACHB-542]